MANIATMKSLLARGPSAPAVAAGVRNSGNAIRTVGMSTIEPAKVAEIGRAITTMPPSSRQKILSTLKDRKVMIGGAVVTVGGLLALNETDLGQQLMEATGEEMRDLLGLFDSVDNSAGNAAADAYNLVIDAQSSLSLDGNYNADAALGVPLYNNEKSISLDMNSVQVRQALTLGYRSLRQTLDRDDILFLQFVVQNMNSEDINVLEDELEFLRRN